MSRRIQQTHLQIQKQQAQAAAQRKAELEAAAKKRHELHEAAASANREIKQHEKDRGERVRNLAGESAATAKRQGRSAPSEAERSLPTEAGNQEKAPTTGATSSAVATQPK